MNLNEIAAHLQDVSNAASELDRTWSIACTWEGGEHFTCSEIETLANLFRALGLPELAANMVDGHAYGDDEGDDHWARRLELEGELSQAIEALEEDGVTLAETFRDRTNGRPWTVAVSGSERHDGHAPFYYTVTADGKVSAVAKVLAYHRNEYETEDVIPVEIKAGVPGEDFWGACNDLREDDLPEPTEAIYRQAVAFLQS